jgi:hypothetical protein
MDSCNDGSGTKGLASAYYITGAPSITRSSTQTLPIWLRAKIIGNTLGLTIIFEYKTSENGTWTVYNTVTNFNTIASANKVEGIWAGVASMNTSSSNTASFEYFKCYRPLGPG